jgi:hypothetical protein
VAPKKSTRLSTRRSSSPGLRAAPLGAAAVLGCCAAHALIVGGVTVTSIAWLGVPAILIGTAVTALWWARHQR